MSNSNTIAHQFTLPISKLEAALVYAKAGYKVFPLQDDCQPTCNDPNCKKPKTPRSGYIDTSHGYLDATNDLEQVRIWWHRWPNANIGIACRPSGICVFDLDTHDPSRNGRASFEKIKGVQVPYPNTPTQITPGGEAGGIHIVFRHPINGAVQGEVKVLNDKTGIDVKSNGYIVAAPSTFHGKAYTWLEGYSLLERAPCEIPAWLSPYVTRSAKPEQPSRSQRIYSDDEVMAMLQRIPAAGYADAYEIWLKIGMAIKECGFDLSIWDSWSQRSSRYESGACAKKWETFRRGALGGDTVGEGTIAHYAVENGYTFFSASPENVFAGYHSEPSAVRVSPAIDQTKLRFTNNDAGNAARLAARFGDRIRWFKAESNWLTWDGKRWKADNTERPKAYAVEVSKLLFQEAVTEPERKFASQSGSSSRVTGMLELAKPHLAITADALDTHHYLFNCNNGTIDLRTGELRPHSQEYFITKLAPVIYDTTARAPRFEQFLSEIFGGSQPLINFVQCALGLSLSGLAMEQKLFVAHGDGSNGKSTLFGIVREIMGDYGLTTEPSLLFGQQRQGGGASEGEYMMRGARFVVTQESEEEIKLNESIVKRLTGGDSITARPNYGHLVEFSPTHKLWLATNHLPRVKSQGYAIWRRIRLVPFNARFVDAREGDPLKEGEFRKDLHLMDKLRAESAGILNWLVVGFLRYQQYGLPECPEVLRATEGYRNEEDALAEFIQAQCIIDSKGKVQSSTMRTAYENWCMSNNQVPISRRAFAARLQEKFASSTTNGRSFWVGVRLLSSAELKEEHLSQMFAPVSWDQLI